MTPRDILERLVAFPTVSRDTNIPLIDWVEAFLDDHGIASHRMPDETGTKHALFASVGPDVAGGVVLSGHTDVVPVDGQDWVTDPWVVTEKDRKLYGRGTCDMKGFDALALAAMAKAAKMDLKRPLQIAFSFDEEVGCEGAPPLIEAMQGVVPRADLAIIGEPSMMKVVTGHKGSTGFNVHVRGFEVHSSILHTGVSAILESAKLIQWINVQNARNQAQEPDDLAAPFTPPWTTLHAGMIRGGTAHNITAKDCHWDMEFRVVPGESADEWSDKFLEVVAQVEGEMQKIAPSSKITTDRYFGVPGLKPEADGAAEQLARRLTGDNATHVVSYGTEAGHFQNAEYSSVICGPGDIAQAHQPNEFLTVEQLNAGEAFLDKLLEDMTKN